MLTDKQLFLFDIDGTLCLGNTWIDGAKELLTLLEKQGKQYLFLTNNSTKSQEDYMEKFRNMGFPVKKDVILTASMATGIYVQNLYPDLKMYALGTQSFQKEMKKYGLKLTNDPKEATGLLVAYDTELTYQKLVNACRILKKGEVPYIATNLDLVCPDEYGFVPDCGVEYLPDAGKCHRAQTGTYWETRFLYGRVCAAEMSEAVKSECLCLEIECTQTFSAE